jgi:hypothetical protein
MAEKNKGEQDRLNRGLDLPEAPKINVKLPVLPDVPRPGSPAPGAYRKVAIAATAASSFISPILVLGVGGWWLDQRLHSGGICAFIGTVIGFIAGIVALLQVIRQLNR